MTRSNQSAEYVQWRTHRRHLVQVAVMGLLGAVAVCLPNYMNSGYGSVAPSLLTLLSNIAPSVLTRLAIGETPLFYLRCALVGLPLLITLTACFSGFWARIVAFIVALANFTLNMGMAVVTNRTFGAALGDTHLAMQHVGAGTWLVVGVAVWTLMVGMVPLFDPEY